MAVLLLFGIRPRWMSVLLAMLLVGSRLFAYASGKINHDILVPLVPAVLAFSNWGGAFRLYGQKDVGTEKQLNDGFPVAVLAFLTAFWMATAGWQKLSTGWLDLGYSVVKGDCFENIEVIGRHSVVGQFALDYFSPWMWELSDWMTIIFELSGVVLVWRRHLFRCWLFVACFFHVGIDLFMLIPYSPAPIAYGVFVPWGRLFGKVGAAMPMARPALLLPLLLVMVLVIVKFLFPLIPFMSLGRFLVWTAPVLACCLVWMSWRSDCDPGLRDG